MDDICIIPRKCDEKYWREIAINEQYGYRMPCGCLGQRPRLFNWGVAPGIRRAAREIHEKSRRDKPGGSLGL